MLKNSNAKTSHRFASIDASIQFASVPMYLFRNQWKTNSFQLKQVVKPHASLKQKKSFSSSSLLQNQTKTSHHIPLPQLGRQKPFGVSRIVSSKKKIPHGFLNQLKVWCSRRIIISFCMKSFAMFSQLHLVGSFCPKPNEFQFWSHHCVECGPQIFQIPLLSAKILLCAKAVICFLVHLSMTVFPLCSRQILWFLVWVFLVVAPALFVLFCCFLLAKRIFVWFSFGFWFALNL